MKIIIIGGGPGGYEAAIRAAQLGGQVTLIEKEHLGGTCLNAGCIPTKVLFSHAKQLASIQNANSFGISLNNVSLDMAKMHDNKKQTIENLRDGVKTLVEANNINLIYGHAEIIDEHHVRVNAGGLTEICYGDYIIIATGSKPIMPPIPGITSERIMTSKSFLSFETLPKSLLIVGGGVIGMEFASIYNALGTEVIVVDANKTILSQVDKDISKRLMSQLKKKGVKFITDALVEAFESDEASVETTYTKKNKNQTITTDYVLMAIGRQANIPSEITKLNIDFDNNGIYVNHHYQTNIKNIYAIGDVNGQYMLAHAASHQGQVAVEHILLSNDESEHMLVPGCIFTFPEIATVGETESSLKSKDIDYTVSKFNFSQNGKAMTMQMTDGYIKVIASNDQLVGVQIIGPNASDLIHEATLGITNHLSIKDYLKTVHAHPTLAETFLEAVRGLYGEAIHTMPSMQEKKLKIEQDRYRVN